MKSIDYPQANVALAKDQPQYQTLFVHVGGEPTFEMTCCLQLSKEELEEIAATGKIWFTQSTFGRGYHPIRMTTQAPFDASTDKVPMDENRTPADVWDKTHFVGNTKMLPQHGGGTFDGPCKNCGKEEQFHFWSSRQCEL